jgi:hypothetical protein
MVNHLGRRAAVTFKVEGCVNRLKNCCHTELPVPACHTSGTQTEQDSETLSTFLQQIVFTLASTSRNLFGRNIPNVLVFN